jgi:hypothetical protein
VQANPSGLEKSSERHFANVVVIPIPHDKAGQAEEVNSKEAVTNPQLALVPDHRLHEVKSHHTEDGHSSKTTKHCEEGLLPADV